MHRYVVIDDFISVRGAESLMDLIDEAIREKDQCICSDHEIQAVLKLPSVSEKVWEDTKHHFIKQKLDVIRRDNKTYQLIGLSDSVTISRHNTPIVIHKDAEGETVFGGIKYKNLICLYKIAVYLNNINSDPNDTDGGTILYDDNKKQVAAVCPKKGRALIFDIRDWHSGAKIPEGKMKYLIGFRLIYKEL